MRIVLLGLMAALVAAPGAAWGRRAVPLMPEVAYADSEVPRYSNLTVSGGARPAPGNAVGWGVELGLSGQGNGTAGDLLGLRVMWGGRFYARIPLSSKIFLKPSLGYFRKAERSGGSGVTEQAYEAGLTAYYALARTSRMRWLVGGAQRVSLLRSTIVTPGVSGDSPLAWQYRVGPATGIAYGINPGMSFTADLEVTFGGLKPIRPYAGISAGILFYLD